MSGTVTASSRDAGAVDRIRALKVEQATEIVESTEEAAAVERRDEPPVDLRGRTGEPDAGTRHRGGSGTAPDAGTGDRASAGGERSDRRSILDFLIAARGVGASPARGLSSEYGGPFDDMVVGMIRAADASGKMHEVLHQLSDLLERSVEVRRELVGATIYPMIVMVIMAISVVIFVTVLLPKLMVPLQAQDVPLPWPTQVLLAVADFVGAWWWLMIAGAIGGFFGWRAWTAVPANRRKVVDGLAPSKVPLLGNAPA